jgi:hypothetical protein
VAAALVAGASTLVTAVGVTRGWRSSLVGVAVALAARLRRCRSTHGGSSWAGNCSSSGCSGCARRSCGGSSTRALIGTTGSAELA